MRRLFLHVIYSLYYSAKLHETLPHKVTQYLKVITLFTHFGRCWCPFLICAILCPIPVYLHKDLIYAVNPNVYAGACTTVTATFTGIAPFTLIYTSPALGTVTQTFSGKTGTFQVCTLPGSAPGSLVVQATELVDLNCTCN